MKEGLTDTEDLIHQEGGRSSHDQSELVTSFLFVFHLKLSPTLFQLKLTVLVLSVDRLSFSFCSTLTVLTLSLSS